MIALASQTIRDYAAAALSRYWPGNESVILRLPFPKAELRPAPVPPRIEEIELPDWAAGCGVQGILLVPTEAVAEGSGPAWERTDWLAAAFWHLNGWAERSLEDQTGPIHSYAFRLRGWDMRMFDHAWVNRIALFLRKAAARGEVGAESRFGAVPPAEILLTHDVDALEKTLPIRIKQSAFHTFNGLRQLARLRPAGALSKFGKAARFLFGPKSDFTAELDRMMEREAALAIRSRFHIFAARRGGGRSPRDWLFDPGYSLEDSATRTRLKKIAESGFGIGLHGSFASWNRAGRLQEERLRLEEALGVSVENCSQHWMRFSWVKTWKAQEEAGFKHDATLGFNDRPAFRNGAALRFRPWDPQAGAAMKIEAMPLVLMDSQFYDYAEYDDASRLAALARWIDEIREVGGEAAVLWHPHTLGADYGWDQGYESLLRLLEQT